MNNFRNKQQGVVLVVALIALVAVSLAGIAMMRTVDTSNVVSGNIAFNEAAIQMADIGAEQAYTEIMGNLSSNPNACMFVPGNCPTNAAGNSYFYPNVSALDAASRLPTPTGGLNWSDPMPQTLPGDATASYSVHYVIERMCGKQVTGVATDETANLQVAPTFAKCKVVPIYDTPTPPSTVSLPLVGQGKLFYRVTVEVTGPRNTRGVSQYFFGVQDAVN